MPTVSKSMKIAAAGGVAAIAAGLGANAPWRTAARPPRAEPPPPHRPSQAQRPAVDRAAPVVRVGTAADPAAWTRAALATKLGPHRGQGQRRPGEGARRAEAGDAPGAGHQPTDAERQAREKAIGDGPRQGARRQPGEGAGRARRDQGRPGGQPQERAVLAPRCRREGRHPAAADKASVLKAFDAGVLGGANRYDDLLHPTRPRLHR